MTGPMRELSGKGALVTGSTQGIGLCIAQALAERGANVVLNGFGDRGVIETTRASIERDHGVQVFYSSANLEYPEEIASMMTYAQGALGNVDILVNNAGIQQTGRIEAFDVDAWNRMLAINLTAVFHTMRAAIPGMRNAKWGRIVNIASVHGLVASATKGPYIASKHGVAGLTKAAALENADVPVTSNAICPGMVRTTILDEQVSALAERDSISRDEAATRLVAMNQPSPAFVLPESVAALAVFLCGEAAREIRGACIPIDGGWTAR